MNYYHPQMQGFPAHDEPYQANPYYIPQKQWPVPKHFKVKQHHDLENHKGNICAYAPEDPVSYNKINMTHWPSMDYETPHPKGWLHTNYQQQQFEEQLPFSFN